MQINGISRHLNSPVQRNENNTGFGLMSEKNGNFLTAGGYKNSEYNNSYYLGGGMKAHYGNDFYIEPGFVAGLVSGYEGGIMPMAMPMVSLGMKDRGAINAMYAPRVNDDPAVLMFNLSIPFE